MKSVLHQGSTFTVRLPIVSEDAVGAVTNVNIPSAMGSLQECAKALHIEPEYSERNGKFGEAVE